VNFSGSLIDVLSCNRAPPVDMSQTMQGWMELPNRIRPSIRIARRGSWRFSRFMGKRGTGRLAPQWRRFSYKAKDIVKVLTTPDRPQLASQLHNPPGAPPSGARVSRGGVRCAFNDRRSAAEPHVANGMDRPCSCPERPAGVWRGLLQQCPLRVIKRLVRAKWDVHFTSKRGHLRVQSTRNVYEYAP
jgi:hypothetical protein